MAEKKRIERKQRKVEKNKMAQIASELADATPERLAQAGRDHAKGEGDSIRRISDWPLARLFSRQQLCPEDSERNKALYDTGEALARSWHGAGLSGYTSIDLNGIGGGAGDKAYMMPVTEYAARCRGEIRLAQQHVGNWTWGVLIDICVEGMTPESAGKRRSGYADAKLARVVALDRLRDGLQRLAELWGHVSHASRDRGIRSFGERSSLTLLVVDGGR